MASVRVEQRNARLAAAIKVEYVKGREGDIAKGTVTIISNTRRGSGEDRAGEATAIQWTLWSKQAENAGQYLGKGSRVNVIGRMQNNNYTDGEGRDVYGMTFTCEELDYLDSKAESDARREREDGSPDKPSRQPTAKPRGRVDRSTGRGRGTGAAH
jgi:single stranded DNA-binding protein